MSPFLCFGLHTKSLVFFLAHRYVIENWVLYEHTSDYTIEMVKSGMSKASTTFTLKIFGEWAYLAGRRAVVDGLDKMLNITL